MMDMLLAGIVGFAIGGVVMFFIMHNNQSSKKDSEVEQKLNDYQNNVEQHFAKTADLIDHLTDSYKEVFEHLSDSAKELLTEEQIQRQLMNRKDREVTLSYLTQNDVDEETDKTQPTNPNPWAG
ncbi:YhcB family protein [Marinicella rhabdoformis]|uniref:YhcB family protein n=1 Tax=Marinicella rhabdoformis TaxID=2580566 RepID=UPI0012AEBC0F|nr:DUF1043 family protein [Marinicella rhabdoformis]